MENQIVEINAPELKGIEQSKAEQIKATFVPMAEMLQGFEDAYSNVISESEKEITKEVTSRAKRLRLDIAKVRVQTEKIRKQQKEEYLMAGRAIDGVSNVLKWAISDKENKLKEIENYFEIQEQKRLEALQIERAEILSAYVVDAEERDLSSMDNDVWEAYLATKKKDYEDRVEAERKAKEERLEAERKAKLHSERKESALPYYQFWSEYEKSLNFGEVSDVDFNNFMNRIKNSKIEFDKKQEEQRKENERLKKEAQERERLAKIEADKRAKAEAERKAKELEAKKAQEAKEKKEREAHEAKLRAERKEKEKLAAELRAKQEAEAKAKQEAEAKIQAELNKGDAAKVKDLIADLEALKTKYTFKSAKNKKMYKDVGGLIDKVTGFVQK